MPIRIYGDNQLAGQAITTTGKGNIPSDGLTAYAMATVGVETVGTATPTVSTSAYATGDCVGGLMTFSTAFSESGGTGLLQRVTIMCKSAQTAQLDMILFSDNPSSSTLTDNAAIAIAAADFDKVAGVVHITDWTNLGTPSVGFAYGLALPIKGTGTSMYGVLVSRGTPTLASTSDIKVQIQVIQG